MNVEETLGERYTSALEAAAQLSGSWLCLTEYDPHLYTVLALRAETQWLVHYHGYCRICHQVRQNSLCLREHRELIREECRRYPDGFCHTCWAGVTEYAVPITLEGKLLGAALLGGGRESETPPESAERELLRAGAARQDEVRDAYTQLPAFSPSREAAIGRLLHGALESARDAAERIQSPRAEESGRMRAEAVCNYLQTGLNDPELTVAGTAEHFHLSREALSRSFHNETGMTIVGYLQQQRVRRAALLLLNTAQPVAEIALASGFRDSAYFSRVFRRKTGMTPEQFRRCGGREAEEIIKKPPLE